MIIEFKKRRPASKHGARISLKHRNKQKSKWFPKNIPTKEYVLNLLYTISGKAWEIGKRKGKK